MYFYYNIIVINLIELKGKNNRDLIRCVSKFNEENVSIPYNLLSLYISPYNHHLLESKFTLIPQPYNLIPTNEFYSQLHDILESIDFLQMIYHLINNFIDTEYMNKYFKTICYYVIYYSAFSNSQLQEFFDGLVIPYKRDSMPLICRMNEDKTPELKSVINVIIFQLFNSNGKFRKVLTQYFKDKTEYVKIKKYYIRIYFTIELKYQIMILIILNIVLYVIMVQLMYFV